MDQPWVTHGLLLIVLAIAWVANGVFVLAHGSTPGSPTAMYCTVDMWVAHGHPRVIFCWPMGPIGFNC